MAFLITETSHDVINEKKGNDLYIIGIFSSTERKNNNGRIYKNDILVREVKEIQNKIRRDCLWGQLGHPPNPEIDPDKIAIKVESLEWRGHDLYGKAKVLDTPQGNIAKTLIREGSLGISSRGLGTVNEDGYVNEDYKLITWDLVTDPSNDPSWVKGIYEAKQFFSKEDKIEKAVYDIEEAKNLYHDYILDTIKKIEKNL